MAQSERDKALHALARAHGKRERAALYARGWGSNRAERALIDAHRSVERVHESLSRELGEDVCDAIWASEWKRWQWARRRRRAGVAGLCGTFMMTLRGTGAFIAGFGAGLGFSVANRRVTPSEDVVRAITDGGMLGVLLRRGGDEIVREMWRDLPASALESRLVRYELTDVLSELTGSEKQLAEKLGRDFAGSLGDLVDAVRALSS